MKQISVLIVEDSVYSADLNVREVKKAGFIVKQQVRVSNRTSMLKALQESEWDIILSDNSMPSFSALEALKIRNSNGVSIPFIIVSEDISQEDVGKAIENGCCAYVTKENLPQLREVVKSVFLVKG